MSDWRARIRSLGDVFFEVLLAEIEALLVELHCTGTGWLKAALLGVVSVMFSFWAIGVLTAFAIALLAVWLTTWQAAGVVFLLLGLVSGGFAFWAWKTFRRERGPIVVVRGHLADHLAWWRKSMAADVPTLEPSEEGEGEEEDPWEGEGGGDDPNQLKEEEP